MLVALPSPRSLHPPTEAIEATTQTIQHKHTGDMLLQHQRFQLGGRVQDIEVESNQATGKLCVLLRDVQDVFPTAARFEREGRPVRFQSDDQGNRLEPLRIAYHPDSILQVVPARQSPMPVPSSPSRLSTSGSSQRPPSPSVLLGSPNISSEEDWRDYLLQRGVRMAILAVVSMMTVLVNHLVSSWMWRANLYPIVAMYWKFVTGSLLALSVAWFLMLVFLAAEVVWFIISTPIATKRSMYQRLFDF
ncbi:hypothetical protein BC939DRAFT_454607 [Gamsiella multidivaricata]|uniref:uncharacterized protein n=1 Tax=Gamsiella multidivaricata TaxID=101098 RepID=UPI00221F9126|nr:uncharacterized protein BC939DRAFT_454607 [Gamsiella multidivaricata]KAI7822049.1 hypothetical protein BC939DRAFT_454607 [Gamsiella multidivaricata]